MIDLAQARQRLRGFRDNFALSLAALLFAMILLPLLANYLVSFWSTEKTILGTASRQCLDTLRNQQDYLDLQLDQIEALAANLGQVEELNTALVRLDKAPVTSSYEALATKARIGYLLSNYRNLNGLVSIDIYSINGNHFHVGDSLNEADERADLRQELWDRTLRSGSSVTWQGVQDNVHKSSSTTKVVVATRLFVNSESSWLKAEPVGMLLISYSTDYLYDHFKSVEFGRDAYLLVLDDQKRFIYHPDKSKIGATVTPAFGNLLQGASGSFLERIAGVDNLLSYSYLPDKKWYMVSVVPKRTLLAPMASIRRAAWVMLLLSSLLIALYVRIFTLRVVAPIGAIAQGFEDLQMERVASGWRMPEPRSLKPVVRLVKWFNAFLENLEKRQEAEHQLLEAHLKLKEMNQRLNERTVQAEEASNSKSQFLANMSHEIRTPMNAVIGYTQLLQRDPALSEQHRAFVATIGRSGQHLLELINDVLEMSKIEAGQSRLNATPFDFHALLGDLMTMFRVRMEEKGLTLDLDLGDTVPRHLCADVMKVKQVLINIIGNALKFTERGGVRITVQAGAPEAGRQEIAVAVQDTGIGFDESNMPTIFNAFEQADSARDKGGTGLGMAISRRYARMMDGDLTATSRIGTGSCFTFRFRPELGLGPAPELAARPREPRRLAPGSKVPRVLIVDDVAVNRVLIRHLLKPFGFNLAEGANGMECLSRMEEAQPDLVLMDSFMPVLDGLETTRRIRQHEPWRAIPVFLITASAFEEDRLRAEQAGVEAFLSKPVMLDVLCAAIERHVPGVVFEY